MILLLCLWTWASGLNRTIDYETARERVLEVGVDLQVAGTTLRRMEAALRERHRAWDPDLGYSAALRASFSPEDISPSATVGLDSSLPIYSGGVNRALLRQAEAALAEAEAERLAQRQRLLWALGDGFLLIQEAIAAVEVEKNRVESEKITLERVVALVVAGARTRADQLQQQATLAEAEASLIAAERAEKEAELVMLLLLRLDPLESWFFKNFPFFSSMEGSATELTSRALEQRQELRASQARLDAAEAALAFEKSGLRPRLDGTVGMSGSLDPRAPSESTGLATVGLSFSGVILDRGVTWSGVFQAEQVLKAEKLQLEQLQWAIRGEVRQAILRREASLSVLSATERRLLASEEALRLVDARYTAGAALYTELSGARLSLLSAQRARVQAQSALSRAELELHWAVGEEL